MEDLDCLQTLNTKPLEVERQRERPMLVATHSLMPSS